MNSSTGRESLWSCTEAFFLCYSHHWGFGDSGHHLGKLEVISPLLSHTIQRV